MTYFEQALHFFEAGKLEEARKYFGYAKNFGSENKKQRATEILEQIDAGTANVDSLVHENALARPVKTLLEEKRYGLALEKLLALGDSASAEELYYLGVLHDDFGMGMPNDPEKARAYFKKSFELGYADAGVGYVYVGTDEDEAPEPLSTEQRKLLEKAAKRGNIRAKAWLLIDDLVVCLKENASEEEIETAKQRYEQFLEKTESDDPFILLPSGEASLRNGVPTVRARGFETLLNLRNYWETDIAATAWVWIGKCFRDGIYVSQDLDEAKFCFNKIVELGKKYVSEDVREFLSGNWKDEPSEDEDATEWVVGKMNEKLRQIEEALFFAHQMWLYDLGESDSDECNVEEFSHILSAWTDMTGALKSVQNLIDDLVNILETHFDVPDAKEILNQKIRREFAALKKIIKEMDSDLVNYTADADSDGMIANARALLSASKIAKKHTERFLEAKEAFIETLKNTVVVLISEDDEEDEEYDEDSDDGEYEDDGEESYEEDDDEYEEEDDEEYEDDGEDGDEDEDEEDDDYVFCTSCGARNPEGANFCYKCGEEIFRDED